MLLRAPAGTIVAGAFLIFGLSASADTLTYTGNSFTNGVDSSGDATSPVAGSISVTVNLSGDLAAGMGQADETALVTSFSITDGTDTITNANAGYDSFEFGTDASGNINTWQVIVYNLSTTDYFTTTDPEEQYAFPGGGGPYEVNDASQHFLPDELSYNTNPGTWTISADAPEPGTAGLLFVATAAGLAGFRRRKRVR